MNFNPIQPSFANGELTPKAFGRIDFNRYTSSLARVENHIVQPQGGLQRRCGSYYAASTKNSAKLSRLVAFQFSTVQAYIIEFGDSYIRFYRNQAQILLAGVPYEIASPYTQAELYQLDWVQSADVLFLAHPNHPPQSLGRSGHTNWTIAPTGQSDGPYLEEQSGGYQVNASATTGAITVTAGGPIFAITDVGRLMRIRHAGTLGYVIITNFINASQVNANVIAPLASTANTDTWRLGAWSGTTGYPNCVGFYEQRLVYANTANQPQTFWMSRSSNFGSFAPTDSSSVVTDDAAITYTIASEKVNAIVWINPGTTLLLGTIGAEWEVKSSQLSEPLTPTNARVVRQTNYGSTQYVRSFRIGSSVIHSQRSGRRLRELTYDYSIDSYNSKDLSLLAEHMFKNTSIKEMTYRAEPDYTFWVVLANGTLIALTYIKDQEMIGYHRHILGGSFNGGPAFIESAAVIPTPDGGQDQLWLQVKRTINGQTVRTVEFVTTDVYPVTPTDKSSFFFMDCGATYAGAPASTISGLTWLEGQTVAILADGNVHPNRVVVGGQVTLQNPASVVNVGLPYQSLVKTLPFDGGAQRGTAQAKTQRIHRLAMRFQDSLGGSYGPNELQLDDIVTRSPDDPMDSSPPLFSGNEIVDFDGDYEDGAVLFIVQNQPLPQNLLAIMPEMTTNEP